MGKLLRAANLKDKHRVGRKKQPKENRKDESGESDKCQTPHYAIDPLLPYLNRNWTVWEPAAGQGYLVGWFDQNGFDVIDTDLDTGQDFFGYQPERQFDCIITNPPYAVKYPWIERCYAMGKPFSLLVPSSVLFTDSGQKSIKKYGFELLVFNKRVNFKMPNKGWTGDGAHFNTMWLTWGFYIGQQITAVAARKLGRKFIGIDQSLNYCRLAQARLANPAVVSRQGRVKQ